MNSLHFTKKFLALAVMPVGIVGVMAGSSYASEIELKIAGYPECTASISSFVGNVGPTLTLQGFSMSGTCPTAGGEPGDGGENPGDGGENPGDGGENPGDGGENPGDGGENPGNGGENPGNGGENPGNGGSASAAPGGKYVGSWNESPLKGSSSVLLGPARAGEVIKYAYYEVPASGMGGFFNGLLTLENGTGTTGQAIHAWFSETAGGSKLASARCYASASNPSIRWSNSPSANILYCKLEAGKTYYLNVSDRSPEAISSSGPGPCDKKSCEIVITSNPTKQN